MPVAVQHVPDDEGLQRLVFFPAMYDDARNIIWHVLFQFPRDQGECECFVWSRYADSPDAVHHIGVEQELTKKERRSDARYVGYLPSIAGAIRGIMTVKGHGFTIAHKPAEGDYHVEIFFRPADDVNITKAEKNELKLALRNVFSALVPRAANA